MPEGGGQGGGGGGGHAVLEGSYELHDTVGTGGFAKVISIFLNVYFKRKFKKVSLLGPLYLCYHFHAIDSMPSGRRSC